MRPGNACISCHSRGEGPRFAIAGTVYPSAHEPNDCNGTNADSATVTITDANGMVHELTPNAAGNFYAAGAIALPYTASITAGGRTRAMAAKQTNGDCNSCHTQDGASGAPGRVMLP
jgi:mono/diheme cytochrome c family protein